MVGELNSEKGKERKNPKGDRLFLYYSKITEEHNCQRDTWLCVETVLGKKKRGNYVWYKLSPIKKL